MAYATQFLFFNNHFGRGRSPYRVTTTPRKASGCVRLFRRILGFTSLPWGLERYIEKRLGMEAFARYKDDVVSRIRAAGRDEHSWLTIAHTWMPGHSPLNYRHDDEEARESFKNHTKPSGRIGLTYAGVPGKHPRKQSGRRHHRVRQSRRNTTACAAGRPTATSPRCSPRPSCLPNGMPFSGCTSIHRISAGTG